MATEEAPENGRRLSISEQAVRDIVENAVLRLQIELGKLYAGKADLARVEKEQRDVADSLLTRITETDNHFKMLDAKYAELERDKAGREAVQAYKKWLTGGAVLATLFMAIQVAISIWLVTRGTKSLAP